MTIDEMSKAIDYAIDVLERIDRGMVLPHPDALDRAVSGLMDCVADLNSNREPSDDE